MKKPRVEKDAYFTPPKPVRQILAAIRREHLPDLHRRKVLEPSCGAGNILAEVVSFAGVSPKLCTGVDIVERPRPASLSSCTFMTADFLKAEVRADEFDLVIGNPPYINDLPERFVRRLMATSQVVDLPVIALLLRLGWLASAKRAEFHARFPADVHVLSERPSFTNDGRTDGCDYGWFVWSRRSLCHGGRISVIGSADPAQQLLL